MDLHYGYYFIIKKLAREFKYYLECLGENTEKYITFSASIKKQHDNGKTAKKEHDNGKTAKKNHMTMVKQLKKNMPMVKQLKNAKQLHTS